MRSPCKGCKNESKSKDECCESCKKLKSFLRDSGGYPEHWLIGNMDTPLPLPMGCSWKTGGGNRS